MSESRAHTPPDGLSGEPADSRSLARRVRGLCRTEELFPRYGDALVMVSGGQDSLALLHLLAGGALGARGPRAIRALHVNHHLRGEESDADQALVEGRCRVLGVPLHVAHAPVDKTAGNVQAVARLARREAALALLTDSGAGVVALGHTLDDQVETLLYRLGRYGGLRALAGMRPSDPPWVRPLLGVRRKETEDYCRAHGLEYAVDRGNDYPGYARTGLRQAVVPAWEEALPGAVTAAGRSAEVASEAHQVIREVAAGALAAAAVGSAGEGHPPREFLVSRLRELSSAVRRLVLFALLEDRVGEGVSRALVLEVEAFLAGDGQARMALGSGWAAERGYGRLSLVPPGAARTAPAPAPPPRDVVALAVPGEARWGGLVVAAEPVSSYRAHDPRLEAYFDAALGATVAGTGADLEEDPGADPRARPVAPALWVRGVRPGDRMRPLGAPGSRLVQDILVDLKVPRHLRRRVPVVGCGETVVWLAGYVLADEGRIGPVTQRLVRLSVREWIPGTGSDIPGGGVGEA